MANGTDVTWRSLVTFGTPILLAILPVIFIALEIRGRFDDHLGRPHELAEEHFQNIYQRLATMEQQLRALERERGGGGR